MSETPLANNQSDNGLTEESSHPSKTTENGEPINPGQELLQDPEIFIEKYFNRTEEEKQEGGMRYKLIEFKPKTPEIAQLIKDLQFFMFGGNGNTAKERKDFPEYMQEEIQQWNKLNEILEQNPEGALKNTKKALLLLSSLLQKVAGIELVNCFSHSFFGERGSQLLRKTTQERGAKAEHQIPKLLIQPPRELWVTSQLSPYTPWTGTIFMEKKRIVDNTDITEEKPTEELRPYGKVTINNCNGQGFLRVEKIRRLQRMAWQENHQLFGVENDSLDAEHARAIITKSGDKTIDTGNADEGWGLKPNCDRLYKIVDATLMTGKEFFEEGKIRFIVPEHNDEE